MSLTNFTITSSATVLTALKKINDNKKGFLVVVDDSMFVKGTLTDGDIRRAFIAGTQASEAIDSIYTKNCKMLNFDEGIDIVIELFKDTSVKFLPIVKDGKLCNIITKNQMHSLLLMDIEANLEYDFSSLDESLLEHEIFPRPWGFYKTAILNEYYQNKIIIVKPGASLSLQSHEKRDEFWVVVHGKGIIQLDDDMIHAGIGTSVFIPRRAKHRLINTDNKERLIISETQLGDYFGEDDIVRYEDNYGRL